MLALQKGYSNHVARQANMSVVSRKVVPYELSFTQFKDEKILSCLAPFRAVFFFIGHSLSLYL